MTNIPASDVTIFICTSCTADRAQPDRPGRTLFEAVGQAIAARPDCNHRG